MRPGLLLTAVALALAGCSGTNGGFVNSPGVRALNAVLADPVANVQDGAYSIATDLTYATESGTTRSPYVITTTGPQTVTFMSGGLTFAFGSINLTALESVNLIATPNNGNAVLVLIDNTGIPTDSEVRVLNVASSTNLAAADVIFTPVGGGAPTTYTVGLNAVSPAQSTALGYAYNVVPSTNYLVQVFPAGQDTGTPLISESVNLVTGQRWTFAVVDSNNASSKVELVQIQDNPEISTSIVKRSSK